MINVLRKNQKGLWIVIALLCIPFVFYFSNSKIGAVDKENFGQIYGRSLTRLDMQRGARLLNLARDLGMFTFLQEMVAGATTENQAYTEFTWNCLILRHEAERLGIAPSTTEIANVVKTLRPFIGASGFDPKKYTDFVQASLPSMGFGEAQIEEVVADQLIFDRMKQLIGAGVQIPEGESKENYERAYGKVSLAVARVKTEDVAKDVQVNDDDIAKYYEAHKAELNSEEKRKVSFVAFVMDDEQKKLAGKERIDVLQGLANKANDFSVALLEKGADFGQVAGKFGVPMQTTGEFTRTKPDPLLSVTPQLGQAAFQLRAEEPNSDALQAGDGFYVLHLAGVDPAKPLTMEEARSKIVEMIKNTRTRELVAAKGAEAAGKLREALKNGAPLDAALAQIGLPTEKLPPFALADAPAMTAAPGEQPHPQVDAPDLQMIKGAAAELSPGDVSDFIPTAAGGVVAVIEKRDAPDPAGEQAKTTFDARFLRSRRELSFYEWLRERRREAGVPAAAASDIEPEAG